MTLKKWTPLRKHLFGLLCGAAVGLGLFIWVSPYLGGECVIICDPYRAVITGALFGLLIAAMRHKRQKEEQELKNHEEGFEILKRRKQKRALWIGTVFFCLMAVFPPWTETNLAQSGEVALTSADHHRLLWDPPSLEESVEAASVDLERLCIQWAVVIALTAAAYISAGLRTETPGSDTGGEDAAGGAPGEN